MNWRNRSPKLSYLGRLKFTSRSSGTESHRLPFRQAVCVAHRAREPRVLPHMPAHSAGQKHVAVERLDAEIVQQPRLRQWLAAHTGDRAGGCLAAD